MIDNAVMQDFIREANPIRHLDDLDPDELSRFVATTRTKSYRERARGWASAPVAIRVACPAP